MCFKNMYPDPDPDSVWTDPRFYYPDLDPGTPDILFSERIWSGSRIESGSRIISLWPTPYLKHTRKNYVECINLFDYMLFFFEQLLIICYILDF